jgi:transposase-like protein
MHSFDSRGAPAASAASQVTNPTHCPACQSTSIKTTAKNPDSASYWRCTKCGDIWNDSRNHAARSRTQRWR